MKTRLFTLVFGALGVLMLMAIMGAHGAALVQAAPLAQTAEPDGFITATVKSGESLLTYSLRYGVSGSALMVTNELRDPNLIIPGQVLVIPVLKSFTPSLTTPFFYVAQPGDTLLSIADKFELPFDVIGNANGLSGLAVVPGETYLIPAGPHVYIVKKGDDLNVVANRYKVPLSFLLKANPSVTNPAQLFVGQRIIIPVIFDGQPVPIPSGTTAAVTASASATGTPSPSTATPGVTATPGAANIPSPTGTFIRVIVQPGESLLTYTLRFGVSASAIMFINSELQSDPDLIFPGNELIIPIPVSFTPSRSTPFFYTVLPGETALSLADRFEMTLATLTTANPGATFEPGTTILVPAGPHLVIAKPGDTPRAIATRYGVTLDFLFKANPGLVSGNFVAVGQKVFIPVRYFADPVPFNP
jgi:LysM repeat protein